jgi:uncharacterized MAPEG superfamily protein
MFSELTILAYYGLWICVVLLVQVLLAVPQLGLGYLAGPRDEGRALTGMASRAVRCLENSGLAMVLFAPAILLLHAKGGLTDSTLLLAQVFLGARILYTVVYIAGVPWIRTLAWMAGFLATAALYLLAL